MKEKNLRCKFGMIETSIFGNVNQEGTQEGISLLPVELAGRPLAVAYGDYVMSCDRFTQSTML
jgi:hypothetical protein